jgi:D-aminoacyl-tRNA deacylase
MRVVIQRVTAASVTAASKNITNSIGTGLFCLIGIENGDNHEDTDYCLKKILSLKLFPDVPNNSSDSPSQEWKKSVIDITGSLLLVSQFTLYARTSKGTKPDFHRSMNPTEAQTLFEDFVNKAKSNYKEGNIKTGFFREYMTLNINNDGPVTIIIDSKDRAS